MRSALLGLCLMFSALAAPLGAQIPPAQIARYHGVLIRVPDLAAARRFYVDIMGFAAEQLSPRMIRLSGATPVYLEEVTTRLRPPADDEARAAIALQTGDIAASITRLRARGVSFLSEQPINVGVGVAIRFRDPFGNIHALLQQTVGPAQTVVEPQVYNSGFKHPDADTAALRGLFGRLGFVVRTERYFPPSLPLGHGDGSFAFMLHENEREEAEVRPRPDPQAVAVSLIFAAPDLGVVRTTLAAAAAGPAQTFPLGQRLRVTIPSGVPVEFWRLTAPAR